MQKFQLHQAAIKRAIKNVITSNTFVRDIYEGLHDNTSSGCDSLINAMKSNHEVEKALRKFELKFGDIVDSYTAIEPKIFDRIAFRCYDYDVSKVDIVNEFLDTYGKYMDLYYRETTKLDDNGHYMTEVGFDVLNMGEDFLVGYGFDKEGMFVDDSGMLIIEIH